MWTWSYVVTPLNASGTDTDPAAPNTPSTFSIGPRRSPYTVETSVLAAALTAAPPTLISSCGNHRLAEPGARRQQEHGRRHHQRPRGEHVSAPEAIDRATRNGRKEQLPREERQQQPCLRGQIEARMRHGRGNPEQLPEQREDDAEDPLPRDGGRHQASAGRGDHVRRLLCALSPWLLTFSRLDLAGSSPWPLALSPRSIQ